MARATPSNWVVWSPERRGCRRQYADLNTSIAYPVLASRAHQGRTKSMIICSLLRHQEAIGGLP